VNSQNCHDTGRAKRIWLVFVLPTFLTLTALLYYGQYYNTGFNYADEGNIALISQRIFEGEIPYMDIEFRAGLLWPYTIVSLFWMFGVNFIAMKVYFFCLATVTVLFGYATVTRLASRKWLGFIAGLLLILIPGVIEKVFFPLAMVANMYFLSRIDLEKKSLGLGQVICATVVMALTFLLRGDLGLCAAIVFVFLATYHTVCGQRPLREALLENGRILGLAIIPFAMVLLPFFIIAIMQGFVGPFTQAMFGQLWGAFFRIQRSSMISFSGTSQAGIPEEAGTLLERLPIETMLTTGPHQLWGILTYLPLLIFAIALIALFFTGIRRVRRGLPLCTNRDVPLLVLFGLALGAFPQFFLWRPDVDHLSWFMPSYIVFAFVLIDRCLPIQMSKPVSYNRSGYNFIPRWRCVLGIIVAVTLTLNLGIYAWGAMKHPFTGSIARKSWHTELFEAENGVRVYLTPQMHAGLTRMKSLIEKYAGPEDFVVCFPYAPGFNFMTNRRTFMRQLYADDSYLLSYPDWQEKMVKKVGTTKPAVIVIGNWAINGTEISRFPNWATQVSSYVYSNYESVDKVLDHTIYVRRDIFMRQKVRGA